MKTIAKPKVEVVNLVDHRKLLIMFREYVDECIDNDSRLVRPMSFDEWYNREYLQNIETFTSIVKFGLTSQEASGGHMSGRTEKQSFQCRVPAGLITESGGIIDEVGLRQCARQLASMQNARLPCVEYNGKLVYRWTQD